MVAVVRAVAAVLLLIAIILHVVGFATNYWVSANLDDKGLIGLMEANGLGSPGQEMEGINLSMGLWKYCMKIITGNAVTAKAKSGPQGAGKSWGENGNLENADAMTDPQISDATSDLQNADESWEENGNLENADAMSDPQISDSMSDSQNADVSWGEDGDFQLSQTGTRDSSGSGMPETAMCQSPQEKDVPGWMKAARALGILAMMIAAVAVVVMIYSYIGDSKGDRARLLPHIIAGISLAAGLVLLIAVILFAVEFEEMMRNTMNTVPQVLAENLLKHSKHGYSFALEALSGVLYVVVSLMLVIPVMMGCGSAVQFDGQRNMAV